MAGWGRYPLLVAEASSGKAAKSIAWESPATPTPELAAVCDHFQWNGLARFGAALRYFQRHGIADAVMAGNIHKVVLFQPWLLLHHVPDLRTIRMFIPHFLTRRKDCNGNTLLGAVVAEFGAAGIRFAPATDHVPELLVGQGQLTSAGPSAWQWKDIRFGWQLAEGMGRLDVGQSVAVRDQAVLAVEAVEGTDECIRRAGALCRSGGFTVVKVAKPQQDMSLDVPHRRPANRGRRLPPPAAGYWPSRPAAPFSSTGPR